MRRPFFVHGLKTWALFPLYRPSSPPVSAEAPVPVALPVVSGLKRAEQLAPEVMPAVR
jgi:hypothetical protein